MIYNFHWHSNSPYYSQHQDTFILLSTIIKMRYIRNIGQHQGINAVKYRQKFVYHYNN